MNRFLVLCCLLALKLASFGAGTGKPTDPDKVKLVKQAAKNAPVFLGSGVTPQTLPSLLPYADGFIVGTYFKKNGVVDVPRVRELMQLL